MPSPVTSNRPLGRTRYVDSLDQQPPTVRRAAAARLRSARPCRRGPGCGASTVGVAVVFPFAAASSLTLPLAAPAGFAAARVVALGLIATLSAILARRRCSGSAWHLRPLPAPSPS